MTNRLAYLLPSLVILMLSSAPSAQTSAPPAQPPPAPALLDKLVGTWVMRGTIEGKQTTHDVEVSWVLNRGYLRLHEISREKTTGGAAEYEAIILMSWDAKAGEVRCLWLDTTSNAGLSGQGIGRAKPTADTLPFAFVTSPTVSFLNTMKYTASANSWTWTMDGLENGQTSPFARLILTRK